MSWAGKFSGRVVSFFVLDSVIGTSDKTRFLRSHMRASLIAIRVDERLLKALLHDVFRILPIASDPQGNAQNHSSMTADQDFNRLVAAAIGGSNDRRVIFFRQNTGRRHRCCSFVEFPYDFCGHGIPPLPFEKSICSGRYLVCVQSRIEALSCVRFCKLRAHQYAFCGDTRGY